jgi:hypothetical protein
MDSMIEQKIETMASASLGTRVSVGGVKTDIKGGSLTISNITIANPPGYNNENAFSLNGIEAAVDYANFDIKRVVIDKPEIVVEEKGGKTNFDQILAGMEKQESAPPAESEPSADGQEEQIIVIRHFRMNGSRASFESESLDHYSDLKVGGVELSNLKGTHSEISKVITNEIIKEITQAAAIELVKAKASEKLDDLLGRNKD